MERGDYLISKIFIFIVCFLPWLVSSLVPIDFAYYDSLVFPFFAPPKFFYPIIWVILYLLIAWSISSIFWTYGIRKVSKYYWIVLLINYLFNQSFMVTFFAFQSPFWGFISCLGTFVSSLFLYHETFQLQEKSTKFLDPYVLFSLFATILSITIYMMNTLT